MWKGFSKLTLAWTSPVGRSGDRSATAIGQLAFRLPLATGPAASCSWHPAARRGGRPTARRGGALPRRAPDGQGQRRGPPGGQVQRRPPPCLAVAAERGGVTSAGWAATRVRVFGAVPPGEEVKNGDSFLSHWIHYGCLRLHRQSRCHPIWIRNSVRKRD